VGSEHPTRHLGPNRLSQMDCCLETVPILAGIIKKIHLQIPRPKDTLTAQDFLQDSARLALHVGESQAALEQQQTRQTPSDQYMQEQGDSKLQSPRQACTPPLPARGKRTLVSTSKPATVVAVTSAAPSVWVAYVLFFCFGLFGLHHLYLKRPHQVSNHTLPSPCSRSVLVVIIEFDK